MRTSCLLLVGLGGAVISLSTPGCGGKLTDAETRYYWDSAAPTGMTSGSGGSTTGADGDNTGGAGGDNTGGTGGDNTGGTGSGDPNPTGAGGASGSSGTTGTGGTTGSGGTTGTGGTGSGTGGSGPAGSGGGGGGPVVDASVGCPESQPMNNAACDQVATCNYGTNSCSCAMAGGGNQRDGGRMTWTCRGSGGTGGGSGRG